MRISDWSSDVCSSDLVPDGDRADRGCRGVTGERGALFGRPPSYRAALLFLAPARLGRDLAASHVLRLDAAGADRQAPRADRLCGVRGAAYGGAVHRRRGERRAALVFGRDRAVPAVRIPQAVLRSEEHTSELQSLMRISY